jgi:hypothetical protein
MGTVNISLPDITLAQVLAAVTWLVSQVVAWGWIDNATGQWVLSLAGTLLPGLWMIGDAIIRHGRSTGIGAQLAQQGAAVKQTRV